MTLVVDVARTPEELDQVRDLMRSFVQWHRRRHTEDLALIDRYFDAAAFERELAGLPGAYHPPEGQLLLATVDEAPAGCVALRRIDETTCEMKRMFVYPQLHGRGVGVALSQAVVAEARSLGYRRMMLDTSIRQREAQALYRRMGFRPAEPYYDMSPDQRAWLVFMQLDL